MFQPGSLLLVAVSGGPDSLCLLHALWRLRRLLRIRLACFHFDHGLRADSASDARYVRRQAARLDVPFFVRGADQRPARGESVEAWARTVRYAAMHAVMEEVGAHRAALGHTADDQAETVLLALVRGGGLEAVSAMAPLSHPIARPLLETTREESIAFCRALGLRPRRDPMNEEPSLTRAAIRTRVIPHMERLLGRGVRGPLARSAALLRRDADYLSGLADQAVPAVVRRQHEATLLAVAALRVLPSPVATRVVRRTLLEEGIVPEAEHIEAVTSLIEAQPGTRLTLPRGLQARRESGYVRLSRPSPSR
jgi:tRNA(Ile)-lysidine synthase